MGISEKKSFTIEAGEEKNVDVHLIDADTDEVVDLTGATEVKARFVNQDGTVLEKLLATGVSVLSIAGGKVRVNLTEAETADLRVGEKQDFEVEAIVGGVSTICRFQRALTIKAPLS